MIEVVGVQADGVASLPSELRSLVDAADVVVGSPRLLETLPPNDVQQRFEWPRPMLAGLDKLLAETRHTERSVVVLATGDPLDSGVATTLIGRVGAEGVRVYPAVGSLALARARMGWSTRETDTISLLTAPASAVRAFLTPRRRILALSADERTPNAIAAELIDAGWPLTTLTVLGDLGMATESRLSATASALTTMRVDLPKLNIVAIELPADGRTIGTAAGRPDGEYANDGQLTKREIRACAIAALRPAPDQLLWDLGAGAGSIAIEWALHDRRCRAIAVERSPERAARIEANVSASGAHGVRVVNSAIDAALSTLPAPQAVFIGGGADDATIAAAWAALSPGGRLVVHTVTIETEQLVIDAHRQYGGELRRISIERAEPLGSYLSWKPARPVVEWAATKPLTEEPT